jgi:hypothetical protein
MASPAERHKVYRFWGVLNRYASGTEDIVVGELGCIGGGDTLEEMLHDVTFKLCDEIERLHGMGERVTARTDAEAATFAEKLREELREEYPGDPEGEVESWRLVRVTADMGNRPPGKTREELDAIAAFERESWAEYLAETEAARRK